MIRFLRQWNQSGPASSWVIIPWGLMIALSAMQPALSQADTRTSPQTSLLPCPDADTSGESLRARTLCLEERIRELDQAQRVLLGNFNTVFDQLKELGLEVNGPEHKFELIPAVMMARTTSFLNGNQLEVFECSPLPQRPGFTIWGATLGAAETLIPDNRIINFGGGGIRSGGTSSILVPGNLKKFGATSARGCAPEPHCIGGGRYCTAQSRTQGCYVDTAWLEWLRRRADAIETYEAVCQ